MTSIIYLSSVLMSIVYHIIIPMFLASPSLGTEAPTCQADLLPREFCCWVSDVVVVERLLRLVWPSDSWCSSTWAPVLLTEETFGVSTATEGFWGLKGIEDQMVFSSFPQWRGKAGEWLQDPARQHLYWQQGFVVDCGTFFVDQGVLERDGIHLTK